MVTWQGDRRYRLDGSVVEDPNRAVTGVQSESSDAPKVNPIDPQVDYNPVQLQKAFDFINDYASKLGRAGVETANYGDKLSTQLALETNQNLFNQQFNQSGRVFDRGLRQDQRLYNQESANEMANARRIASFNKFQEVSNRLSDDSMYDRISSFKYDPDMYRSQKQIQSEQFNDTKGALDRYMADQQYRASARQSSANEEVARINADAQREANMYDFLLGSKRSGSDIIGQAQNLAAIGTRSNNANRNWYQNYQA